jgi:hypothetical protein
MNTFRFPANFLTCEHASHPIFCRMVRISESRASCRTYDYGSAKLLNIYNHLTISTYSQLLHPLPVVSRPMGMLKIGQHVACCRCAVMYWPSTNDGERSNCALWTRTFSKIVEELEEKYFIIFSIWTGRAG